MIDLKRIVVNSAFGNLVLKATQGQRRNGYAPVAENRSARNTYENTYNDDISTHFYCFSVEYQNLVVRVILENSYF